MKKNIASKLDIRVDGFKKNDEARSTKEFAKTEKLILKICGGGKGGVLMHRKRNTFLQRPKKFMI